MSKPNVSPNTTYANNLAVVSAALELGGAVIQRVMGGDAVANTLQGEQQGVRDVQEMLASRLSKTFGV